MRVHRCIASCVAVTTAIAGLMIQPPETDEDLDKIIASSYKNAVNTLKEGKFEVCIEQLKVRCAILYVYLLVSMIVLNNTICAILYVFLFHIYMQVCICMYVCVCVCVCVCVYIYVCVGVYVQIHASHKRLTKQRLYL